jgi:hypothetical protein
MINEALFIYSMCSDQHQADLRVLLCYKVYTASTSTLTAENKFLVSRVITTIINTVLKHSQSITTYQHLHPEMLQTYLYYCH